MKTTLNKILLPLRSLAWARPSKALARPLLLLPLASVLVSVWVYAASDSAAEPKGAAPKAALTVMAVSMSKLNWSTWLSASGSLAAWQEAVISAELAGLRLTEVAVNVGDSVQKGAVLARLQRQTTEAELAQTRAGIAEAVASLAEAQANAERARALQPSGALSSQQILQYTTAEQTAQARLGSLKARLQADEVRLAQTVITAPDSGIVSARTAAVGAVVQPGQELFRLIRQSRLEWQAEVPAADLARIKPGMKVQLGEDSGQVVSGIVRMVAPTVDRQTRNGLVYVDVPRQSVLRAGMFVRGQFDLGERSAKTLPQSALIARDGFAYVMRIGPDDKVIQTKLQIGRRQGDRVEVLAGLDDGARVVATGAAFLVDGDTVRVVATAKE